MNDKPDASYQSFSQYMNGHRLDLGNEEGTELETPDLGDLDLDVRRPIRRRDLDDLGLDPDDRRHYRRPIHRRDLDDRPLDLVYVEQKQ
jgi:hypothetical protein